MERMNRMFNAFYNTSSMVDHILKKEKIKLPLFVISMVIFILGLVPVFDEILKTSSNMQVLIETMKNPAMISMVGPVFVEDSYTLGSMYANYMTVFTAIIFAVWNILFISRNTRLDEEMGRSELLRALPLGRLSNDLAVILINFFANFAIAVLLIIGFKLISPEVDLNAVINFTLSTVGFGFLFSVITLLFAQVTSTARITNSLSFLTLMIFYMARAIGDIYSETLSKLSPLGLITRTESFVNNYTWPLLVLLVEIIVITVISIVIMKNRDLGSGIITERRGRSKLSPFVRGIFSFTFKILKSQFIIWGVTVFLFSSMYGSTLGDLEGYINSSDLVKKMLQVNSEFTLTEQFVGLLVLIMSMITCIPVLLFTTRVVSEESNYLSEEILNKPVSRYKYLLSFIFVSIVAAVVFQLLVASGFWLVGKQFLEDIPSLSVFIKAVLNYIPAILATLSIAILFIGIKTKLVFLSYIYLFYSFIVVYIGRMLDLPKFMEKISPFGLTPNYPLKEMEFGIHGLLLAIFIILSAIGLYSYRNRDLNN